MGLGNVSEATLFSICEGVYKFDKVKTKYVSPFYKNRKDLEAVLKLARLVFVDLRRPLRDTVCCTDASLQRAVGVLRTSKL